jgi:monoamine oxidase
MVITDLQRSAEERGDESFASFIRRSDYSEYVKRWAIEYVEGFHAAPADAIGTASIAADARAEEQVEGHRLFTLQNGYGGLVDWLVDLAGDMPRLSTTVERIVWKPGSAVLHVRSALNGKTESMRCRCVIVTVPLPILQDGIEFEPEPEETLSAARSLAMGHAYRITLLLERAFWEDDPELRDKGFLLSREPCFPTWWTSSPAIAPVITGWSAGPAAARLAGESTAKIIDCALTSLERIAGVAIGNPLAVHFHDWQRDSRFRGVYSYAPTGALGARKILTTPVKGTLFFAGEATDADGHSSTVHDAMVSGKRAARQVMEALGG